MTYRTSNVLASSSRCPARMKVLHQLLLVVVTALARVSGAGDCLLPVPDPHRLFSSTSGGEGQELARVAASEYKSCVAQCCEQTEGLCNVILFHKPAIVTEAAAEPNCVIYSCQPINSCSFTADDGVQIYAASEVVLAIVSGTEASSNHSNKKYSKVENTTVKPAVEGTAVEEGVTPSSTAVASTTTTLVLKSTPTTEDGNKKTQTTTAMLMTPASVEPSKSDTDETGTITSTTIPESVSSTYSASSSQVQSTISREQSSSSTTTFISTTKQEKDFISTEDEKTTTASSSLTPGTTQASVLLQKSTQADQMVTSTTDGKLPPTGPPEKSPSFSKQTPSSTQTVESTISTSTTWPDLEETPKQNTGQATTLGASETTTQMWTPGTMTSLFQSSPSTQKSAETQPASNQSAHGQVGAAATVQLNIFHNGTSLSSETSSAANNTYVTGEHSSSIGSLSVASRTVLIGTLSVGCIFFFAVLVIVGKRLLDGWKKRHYSRIDYLVDGMYSE